MIHRVNLKISSPVQNDFSKIIISTLSVASGPHGDNLASSFILSVKGARQSWTEIIIEYNLQPFINLFLHIFGTFTRIFRIF